MTSDTTTLQTEQAEQTERWFDRDNLDEETFAKFASLVYNVVGINLGPHKKALVCARISKRMRQLGIYDFREYYDCVAKGESRTELVELVDAICTNVTEFYRDPNHIEFLKDWFREMEQAGQTRFRIWSAACSSGEEPYSIAIAANEALQDPTGVRILATDISSKVLRRAHEGIYQEKRFEKMPPEVRERYFTTEFSQGDVRYRVREELRRLVTLGRINLSNPPFPLEGRLDIVFCRNVMIYFDNDVRGRLLSELFRLIRPGGHLMVGRAESLSGMLSNFKSVVPSVYVRP
jgi:chemotaxis protein methyltransferase CheR